MDLRERWCGAGLDGNDSGIYQWLFPETKITLYKLITFNYKCLMCVYHHSFTTV